jgi:hypothetical protein
VISEEGHQTESSQHQARGHVRLALPDGADTLQIDLHPLCVEKVMGGARRLLIVVMIMQKPYHRSKLPAHVHLEEITRNECDPIYTALALIEAQAIATNVTEIPLLPCRDHLPVHQADNGSAWTMQEDHLHMSLMKRKRLNIALIIAKGVDLTMIGVAIQDAAEARYTRVNLRPVN